MTGSRPPGFPIQKSPDQRILGSSPRLIAAGHVFHRLPTPRHPPVALFILVCLRILLDPLKTTEYSVDFNSFLSLPSSIVNEPDPKVQAQAYARMIPANTLAATTGNKPRILVEVEGIEPTTFSLQS